MIEDRVRDAPFHYAVHSGLCCVCRKSKPLDSMFPFSKGQYFCIDCLNEDYSGNVWVDRRVSPQLVSRFNKLFKFLFG